MQKNRRMNLILVINSGSSSLKFGLFRMNDASETPIVSGKAESIGKSAGALEIKDATTGKTLHEAKAVFGSQSEALDTIRKHLDKLNFPAPVAIGHRMVNGGPKLVTHQLITPEVLEEMARCVDFAPLHTPEAIRLMRHLQTVYPSTPQYACFDTAFHQTLPECAYRFPIPEKYAAQGIRRYGFHGLSYASIVHQLGDELPQRMVVAHLGNGSSLAAIEHGHSVDTSMGLTPTGGVITSTRTGDLDPGVLLFLMREGSNKAEKLSASELEIMVNQQSGLLSIGGSKDMRELEQAAEKHSAAAQLAIDMYCRAIAKTIAAYASVLGGLDLLVFAGGIGENSPTVRNNVCGRLRFLGIEVDAALNQAKASTISNESSSCPVRIIPSEEEQQIARYVRQLYSA